MTGAAGRWSGAHAAEAGPAGGDRAYREAGSGPARLLLVLFGTATVLFVGLVGATAWAAHSLVTDPWVEVRVAEHDGDRETTRVSIPLAVASTALAVAPHLVPAEDRRALERELGRAEEWGPVVRELADELERMPDATLVEVEGREAVRVSKRGDVLVVEVRSADGDVDVAVPVALVRELARVVG